MPASRLLLPALLVLALPISAQQPPQHRGGPYSGPAPAPPPLAPDDLQHPGVPQGKLIGPLTLRSRIYDGMVS